MKQIETRIKNDVYSLAPGFKARCVGFKTKTNKIGNPKQKGVKK